MTKYIFIKLLSLQTCASSTIKEQMHTDVQSILTVLHWIDTRGMCVVVQFYPYYSKPSTSYKLTKKKPQISLRKILRNKWHHAKVGCSGWICLNTAIWLKFLKKVICTQYI